MFQFYFNYLERYDDERGISHYILFVSKVIEPSFFDFRGPSDKSLSKTNFLRTKLNWATYIIAIISVTKNIDPIVIQVTVSFLSRPDFETTMKKYRCTN